MLSYGVRGSGGGPNKSFPVCEDGVTWSDWKAHSHEHWILNRYRTVASIDCNQQMFSRME